MLELKSITVQLLLTLCFAQEVALCYDSNCNENIVLVDIIQSNFLHQSDERYLSIALDCSLIGNHWETFNASHPKVVSLAQGLSPAVLRLGGTSCDYVIFNSTSLYNEKAISDQRFKLLGSILKAKDWDRLVELSKVSNYTLLYDINVMLRTENSEWDPSNFKHFLAYNAQQKVDNLMFELGNEPNNFPVHFNQTITGAQLAHDFSILKKVIQNDNFYRTCKIVGADIGNPYLKGLGLDPATYIHDFFANGYQYIDALTWHQYYLKGSTARLADFTNPVVMDTFQKQVDIVQDIIEEVLGPNSSFPVWMGETSSAYNSGAPNLSDTYVAGFLWMDKLGVAARSSYDIVIRQTFYGGRYSLIDNLLDPLPDYWLSLLYKRLVGTRVLSVKTYDKSGFVRVYAHCTRGNLTTNSEGMITLYAMNLNPNSTVSLLPTVNATSIDSYLLEPEDNDLQSKRVLLNGKLLSLDANYKLPEIHPIKVGKVTLKPLRFGFFILHTSPVAACK